MNGTPVAGLLSNPGRGPKNKFFAFFVQVGPAPPGSSFERAHFRVPKNPKNFAKKLDIVGVPVPVGGKILMLVALLATFG